jgi:membrane associated rhomboid family serine protease
VNQTRLGSLIESAFSVAIGLAVSLVANALIFPRYGFHPTLGENAAISAIYTAISLVRQFLVRRYFNAQLHRAANRIARAAS